MKSSQRYFTHYWLNKTFATEQELYEGIPLRHTGGNQFRRAKVRPGDLVYAWSFSGGNLYLVGRMQVDHFGTQADADALYEGEGIEALPASDHLFAKDEEATLMRFDLIVPVDVIKKLSFIVAGKTKGPVFVTSTEVDHQTFRGVRELTYDSAKLLDELIDLPNKTLVRPQVVSSSVTL